MKLVLLITLLLQSFLSYADLYDNSEKIKCEFQGESNQTRWLYIKPYQGDSFDVGIEFGILGKGFSKRELLYSEVTNNKVYDSDGLLEYSLGGEALISKVDGLRGLFTQYEEKRLTFDIENLENISVSIIKFSRGATTRIDGFNCSFTKELYLPELYELRRVLKEKKRNTTNPEEVSKLKEELKIVYRKIKNRRKNKDEL